MRDWWRVALRELPTGLALGAILGVIGVVRIAIWQKTRPLRLRRALAADRRDRRRGAGRHRHLRLARRARCCRSCCKRLGFDPASASAPFVATLVDVTGLVIYFSVALLILRGTLL